MTWLRLMLLGASVLFTSPGVVAMHAPDEFDDLPADILSRLGESDRSQPHSIDFYFYLPTQARANQAAERLLSGGFTSTVRPSAADDGTWLCKAALRLVPTAENLAAVAALLRGVALEMGAEFDGWEADVVKHAT